MASEHDERESTFSGHQFFLIVGIVFLTSAIGDGDIASYTMGAGLLVMGIFSPSGKQRLLSPRLDRVMYAAAALLVIVIGAVQVGTAMVEAIKILGSGTAVQQMDTVLAIGG
ncbi:MAG: hypothetical protein ACOC2N_01365 [Spirochaetota bacterium]